MRTLHRILPFIFIGVVIFLVYEDCEAQTRQYKRVMIVSDNSKQRTNDDAHYLTFNHNGIYESDKNGFSVGGKLIEYQKDNKGFHIYQGYGFHGYANYYFSSDYSRLNIVVDKKTTYVYQREYGETNAGRRIHGPVNQSQSGTSSPSQTPVPYPYGNQNSDHRQTTPHREQCSMCNGTGNGTDFIKYAPDYTGNSVPDYWCSECGKYTYRHYHEKRPCGKCRGKGYIERYY